MYITGIQLPPDRVITLAEFTAFLTSRLPKSRQWNHGQEVWAPSGTELATIEDAVAQAWRALAPWSNTRPGYRLLNDLVSV